MLRFYKISSYLLFCLNLLLVFFLYFEEKVSLPYWFNPIGRMHPLLLHLPIGFAVVLVFFLLLKKEIEAKSFEIIQNVMLTLTALSAVIVAIMGFLLSQEGVFDEISLQNHKWSGVAVSILSYLLVLFKQKAFPLFSLNIKAIGLGFLLILIIIAGHLGANITHGENYLFEAFEDKKGVSNFSENKTMYETVIFPILEAKCIACHNDNKIKGELNMTSIEKILKGGKNGPIWKTSDAQNSHLIQRIILPLEEKEHMPPKGKIQLTNEEIALLNAWINEGADVKKIFKSYDNTSKTKVLALQFLNSKMAEKEAVTYSFPMPSDADLKAVNTPYCSVFQLANSSPALQADFFISKKFERKSLENLQKVSEQLVILNLAKMPIKDEDIALISNFPNLEKITLNQTDILGENLDQFKKCKKLRSIALAGTKISKSSLEKIMLLPSLKEVFVWNTAIDKTISNELSKKYPSVKINIGSENNEDEYLKLNPPILVNEDFVIQKNTPITLKHTLKDVRIRYTLDGSEPDSSTSPIYQNPIIVNDFTLFKAIATKSNWYTSDKVEFSFFKSSLTPDNAYFLTQPDPKYMGKGAQTLIDLKKGLVENFQDPTWLGYRDNDFITMFEFKKATPLTNLTISYLQKIDSYIIAPSSIEIWGGDSKSDLKMIKKISPKQPLKMELGANLSLNISLLPLKSYKLIQIKVKPIQKLPIWHPGKGQKAWFFVDEIFFN